MVSWLRLRFRVGRALAEMLGEALEEAGAIAVSIEGRDDEHILQAATEEAALWEDCAVSGLFAGDTDLPALVQILRERISPASLPEPTLEPLADSDWAESWKAHYHPFLVAPGVWICPSWLPPPDPAAITLRLDPGMAFGTGEHPTTALCLTWLTEQPLAGKTVLDYGTGSGILAMAALKLGAARATGVDIDPKAVEIARENLALNDLADRFTAGTPEENPAGFRADIVLANILANPLRELAPRLAALVKPGGKLALAGMLAEQADEVAAAYAGAFDLHTRRERHGWTLLAGTRRALLP
jgi:ribosomal protein L11 methyltransferase